MSGKTKYKVGDIFYGLKEIVEYCGSHPTHRVSLWRWKCLRCGVIHGPSMTATLTRKDRLDSLPRCCYRLDKERNPRWLGVGDIPKTYWNQLRDGANKRGIEFDATLDDLSNLWNKQNGICALSGLVLTMGYKNSTASIDRIKSSMGYTRSNIQWVHKDINRMKTDFPEEYFIKLCEAVAANDSKRTDRTIIEI